MRFLSLPLLLFLASGTASAAQQPAPPLRVGVTLHPYYSWTANVVAGTDVEVRAILPGEVDAGSYQPRPEDIAKLADLDALVVNGIGHDDFIRGMVEASGNRHLTWIRPNDAVPLLRSTHGEGMNSHTFLSFTNAIQQTYAIQRALASLRPELAETFGKNATAYAKRLRAEKARVAQALVAARVNRVVTVHDGYAYLMQEFGIEIVDVVEPAHGLVPSALELQTMIERMRKEKIRVVFSEEGFPEPLLAALREGSGARVYVIRHVASGAYTPEKFEQEMQANAEAMVRALVKDPSGS